MPFWDSFITYLLKRTEMKSTSTVRTLPSPAEFGTSVVKWIHFIFIMFSLRSGLSWQTVWKLKTNYFCFIQIFLSTYFKK